MSGAANKKRAIIRSVSIKWASIDVGCRSVVVCYDLYVPHGLSLILTHVFVSYRVSFFYKPIFNNDFYLKFISFTLLYMIFLISTEWDWDTCQATKIELIKNSIGLHPLNGSAYML
jgi:hypothetical protein